MKSLFLIWGSCGVFVVLATIVIMGRGKENHIHMLHIWIIVVHCSSRMSSVLILVAKAWGLRPLECGCLSLDNRGQMPGV